MSSEDFKILKEINSLFQNKEKLLHSVKGELDRIDFLNEKRTARLLEKQGFLSEQESILKAQEDIEKKLASLLLSLNQDKSNLNGVTTQAAQENLEKQIKVKEDSKDSLEEESFLLLENFEELDLKIKDCDSFNSGVSETINEIQAEVDSATQKLQGEIDILTKRISLLEEELNPIFKSVYERVSQKKLKISSFTRLKNNSCEFCRFSLSVADAKDIEVHLKPKVCSGCGRLFIPEKAF